MRYAVIENSFVTNIILLENEDDWHTPSDILVQSDTANIGDGYDGTAIIPAPLAPITWKQYQQEARTLLDKSDIVATRCFKAGVSFPAEWQTYVAELRVIISASTGTPATLPINPAYPVGT